MNRLKLFRIEIDKIRFCYERLLCMMQELIDEVSEILKEFKNDRDQRGLDYNIFTLMDIERGELNHEHMIYTILNDRRNLALREEIVEQFLISMGLPKIFTNERWIVEKEYYTENNGRMDLFFKTSGQHSKKCVVVELKVDACDQERQLKRYEEYILANDYDDYRIIYLTLDGREPSEQSCEDMEYPRKMLCRSFGDDLLRWLECCIKKYTEYNIDESFIQQYKILIMKLTEEKSMEKDIAELIKGSRELTACLELENVLPVVKGQILYDFMDAIYSELQRKGCEVLYEDYECAEDYYKGQAHIPYIIYKITELTSRNKIVTLAMDIYVNYMLNFSIEYFDEQGNTINNEQFKKGNKRINQKVEDAVTEILNTEIRSNSHDCIIYQNILDNNNCKYDFKHFSENCAELKDESVLKKEAKRIARNIAYYIKEIKAYLEDEE